MDQSEERSISLDNLPVEWDRLQVELDRLRRIDLSLRRIVLAIAERSRCSFRYRNHRGKISDRKAILGHLRHAATEWHPEPQWLVDAWDCDKLLQRTFAVADILEWLP
jgi:predicted DNA-binding transcriptional regulator YafY